MIATTTSVLRTLSDKGETVDNEANGHRQRYGCARPRAGRVFRSRGRWGSGAGERAAADDGDGGARDDGAPRRARSEEHTSELQSRFDIVCRLLLEKKKQRASGTATTRK